MSRDMKRGFRMAVYGAAIAATGLVGCAGGGHEKPQTTTTTMAAAPSSGAAEGTVRVDGHDENLQGSCIAANGGGVVNISLSGATTKINVALDGGPPPNVSSVVLVTAGIALAYQLGKQGNVRATEDGNTYNITGIAVGQNEAMDQAVSRSFEIRVTCR
jgi:ipoprotein LpqH